MIRKCYLVSVMLMVSTLSRGQHANVQNSVVGVGTGTLIRNGSGTVNTLDTVGDPSIFGMNAWNVYAWNSTGLDSWNVNYAGYYVDTALSMNTLAYWNDGQSPSYAPDYMGQPVTDENHSFAAKRRGFPLGYYMINIPGHDDWSYLLIDGVEVWNHEDCCDYHGDVWQGFLTDTTTIEFRIMEFGGGSYGFIELIPQHVQAIATTTFIPCHNGTSTVEISASGGFPPYSGTGTFTLNAGSYEYFVVDSLGDSSLVEVNIHEPTLPDSVIVTNIPSTFCEGDTITLTAPGNGSALVLSGGGPRVIIPINSPETDYTFEIDFKTTEPDAGISSVRDADLGGSFDRDLYLSGGNIFHRLYSEEVINSYSQNYADDMWHHVAVVVEAGVGQRIYVDGIMVASGSKDYSDFSWDNTLNIGFANDWFAGSIDNVRLWNVVRTQTEIEQDQMLHVIGSLPGLIGNWDFDDLNGSSAYNSVDNTECILIDGATVAENNTNTYLWSTGDTARSITAFSSGSISVGVTTANGCAVNTTATAITMNALPALPAISLTTATTFCEGGRSLLTSSSIEGNQWNKNDVAIVDDTLSTFNATESGSYSVTVTNSFGCSKTSQPEIIDVIPGPPIPIIDAASATTFCDGGSVDLSVRNGIVNRRYASSVIAFSTEWGPTEWGSVQVLGAPNVYPDYGDIENAWSPLDMEEPDEFLELGYSYPIPINYIDIYETFGPGTVDTVYVKNPNTGLLETVYTAIPAPIGDSLHILHITFPMTSFPVSEIRISMDMSAVEGWNEIDAVEIGNDLPTSYVWSNGLTVQGFNATASETFTVTVTNSIGCLATSLPLTVTENANPVVSAGPDMYSGACATEYILTGGAPAGGVYSGTGVMNGIFDPSIGGGTFNIQYFFEDTNGCSNSSTAQMLVSGLPSVSLNSFVNICTDADALTLTGGSPTGGTYTGMGITNGVFDPSIGVGTYAIEYSFIDSFGCSASATQSLTVDVCTGIRSSKLDELVSIYPNPAHGKVKIEYVSEGVVQSLELFNATGSIIYFQNIKENNPTNTFEIDLSSYPSGVYLIRLQTNNGAIFKKLMLE